MNDLNKDILIGSLFIAGILSFISGLFVISTVCLLRLHCLAI
jgi:hypothetical protein